MVIHQVRSLALTLALLRSAHSAAACLGEHLWAHVRLFNRDTAVEASTSATRRARVLGSTCHLDRFHPPPPPRPYARDALAVAPEGSQASTVERLEVEARAHVDVLVLITLL